MVKDFVDFIFRGLWLWNGRASRGCRGRRVQISAGARRSEVDLQKAQTLEKYKERGALNECVFFFVLTTTQSGQPLSITGLLARAQLREPSVFHPTTLSYGPCPMNPRYTPNYESLNRLY